MNLTRNQIILASLVSMAVFGIGAGVAYDFNVIGLSFSLGGISFVSFCVAFLRYLSND